MVAGVGASVGASRLLLPVVGVASLFWGIRRVVYGRLSVRTPADWAVALLLLTLPLTLLVTATPDTTRPQVYRLLAGLALYYAIVNWASSARRLRLAIRVVMLAGLALALLTPFSVTMPTLDKLPFIPRLVYLRFTPTMADTVNPNVMAGTLVIMLAPALSALFFTRRSLGLLNLGLALAASCAMLVMLLLTQSRGGLLALAALLAALILLRWRRGWLVLLVAAGLGLVVVQARGFTDVLSALGTNSTFGGLDARREIWSRAMFMTQDFAFTGIGMGSFEYVAGLLYPFILAPPDTPHAHNLFLQVAVDLGVPGLIAWLAIFLIVTAAAWKIYRAGRRNDDPWVMGLGAGLLGSQVALATHGLLDAVTWGMVRTAVIPWALWGLAVAGSNIYAPAGGLRVNREDAADMED